VQLSCVSANIWPPSPDPQQRQVSPLQRHLILPEYSFLVST
jgi:hypothetical protein